MQISADVLYEARAWVADCEGRRGLAPEQITKVYVAKHYPGGWRAFEAMCAQYTVVR